MNPRHAAALALMGWYLMVPLPGNDPIPSAGVRSFLKWIHLRSFDSAAECEDGRTKLVNLGIVPNLGSYDATEQKKLLLLSQCVASDDPRLKEN
jgi:hypothetical protein